MLAIPHKRTARVPVTYLTEAEIDALLAAPDKSTWIGRRDHAMFALTIQTGLRISELIALDCQDITLATGAHVHTVGKGRKHRHTPLTQTTRTLLKAWLAERAGAPATRCSRRAPAHASAATPSNAGSLSTLRPPAPAARR